jgi:hypothetical protein
MAVMDVELSSQAERGPPQSATRPEEEAVDALVYEMHPALVAQGQAHYPYDRPPEIPFQPRPQDLYRPLPTFSLDFLEPPPEYVVPQRFGMSAMLGITTALAILFGCMRWLGAEPGWYLFLGAQSIVICLVQMFQGRAPRKASAVAGAIIAPLFVLAWAWLTRHNVPAAGVLCFMVVSVPLGGFVGYLNGTCAAGIFLVMDKLEKYLKGESAGDEGAAAPAADSSPTVPAP